jgi:hypothetical protein
MDIKKITRNLYLRSQSWEERNTDRAKKFHRKLGKRTIDGNVGIKTIVNL